MGAQVRNPEKYNFVPIQLLTYLIETYCNLFQRTGTDNDSNESIFAKAVVQVALQCLVALVNWLSMPCAGSTVVFTRAISTSVVDCAKGAINQCQHLWAGKNRIGWYSD